MNRNGVSPYLIIGGTFMLLIIFVSALLIFNRPQKVVAQNVYGSWSSSYSAYAQNFSFLGESISTNNRYLKCTESLDLNQDYSFTQTIRFDEISQIRITTGTWRLSGDAGQESITLKGMKYFLPYIDLQAESRVSQKIDPTSKLTSFTLYEPDRDGGWTNFTSSYSPMGRFVYPNDGFVIVYVRHGENSSLRLKHGAIQEEGSVEYSKRMELP